MLCGYGWFCFCGTRSLNKSVEIRNLARSLTGSGGIRNRGTRSYYESRSRGTRSSGIRNRKLEVIMGVEVGDS
jgi:hypothetical protein